MRIAESPGAGLASSVARAELCSLPNAAVMSWTGFKDLTAGLCPLGAGRSNAGRAPAASCYGLAHGITEEEDPTSNLRIRGRTSG